MLMAKGEKLLKIGAEARLTIEDGKVHKHRISKGYRVKAIDARLRKERTRSEARLIDGARRAGVETPIIFNVDDKEMTIVMELVEGVRVDKVLTKELCGQVGKEVAKIHNAGIIHGDLTTSNILVVDSELREFGASKPRTSESTKPRIYFIDFGLGEFSRSIEKRGVDLKVLEGSIIATKGEEAAVFVEAALDAYEKAAEDGLAVMERLKQIEKRGRYKKKE